MKKAKKNEVKTSKVENITAKAEVANQVTETATVTKKAKKAKKAEEPVKVILPIQEEIAYKKAKDKKKAKKDKVVKEVAAQQKESILEEVVSKREVKYIYPEDVKDTLSRKTWRQKTRNELHRLELQLSRIKDTNSKEYKKALKEFNDFKAIVLKPEQVA